MTRFIFLAGFLFSAVHICSAAACTGGSLAGYFALGSGGCTIGSDTVSNFQTAPGTTGATSIAEGALSITPGGGSNNPFLTFAVNKTASTGTLLESIFTFEISGPVYTGSAISLTGSSETADGAVTEIENFCAGGSFGPDGVTGCSGAAGSLLTLNGVQNSDQSSLGPVSLLNVTNDFILDSGTAGSASGGIFTDTFTATPEPSSLFLGVFGASLAGLSLLKKRRVQVATFERTK